LSVLACLCTAWKACRRISYRSCQCWRSQWVYICERLLTCRSSSTRATSVSTLRTRLMGRRSATGIDHGNNRITGIMAPRAMFVRYQSFVFTSSSRRPRLWPNP
jgi:hypothetical protein